MRYPAGLRVKALVLIVPVVVGVVIVSGLVSAYSSRAALLRIATRLIAFKAEQVRDFAFSQWEVLGELGYADDSAYRRAGQAAIQSYASSLIRTPSERVFAIDDEGTVTMSSTLVELTRDEATRLVRSTEEEGWFEATIAGVPVVGQTFRFDPLGWRILVTERRDEFYRDVRLISFYHAGILFGGIAFAVASLLVFLAQAIVPIERLTAAMGRIAGSLSLSDRVPEGGADEVGELGRTFNVMSATVEIGIERLRDIAERERVARVDAAAREQETLQVLGTATEFRDLETGAHIARVGALSGFLAQLLQTDDAFQELTRKAAPLHDVGKIGIADQILRKPGKLTKREYDAIKEHTVIGWRILRASESIYLRAGAEIALNHHERWDGRGYPAGIPGPEIPLSGRIVAVTDVYDALRSDRPYKQAQSHGAALELVAAGRGTQFDPEIVDLFVSHEARIAEIYDSVTEPQDPEPPQPPPA